MRGVDETRASARYVFGLSFVLLFAVACSGSTVATTSSTAASETSTSVAAVPSTTSTVTATTVDPSSVARLDGTWFFTYRVVDYELEGVGFDDFIGISEVGDVDAARVWILEHQCDEGVCDADLDSRRPEAPEEEFLETVLVLREDGTYGWGPEGEVGFGTCVVDDGEVFEEAFKDEFSIDLEVTDVEAGGNGWVATALSGTRVREAEPVEEAAAAGCPIRWRTTAEVEAVRTDPDDPVPEFLPPGSDVVTDRIGYLHLGGSSITDGLWSVDPDGTDVRPILEVEGIEGFAWSPDADRLAYSDSNQQLWVAAADGSNPVSIGRGTLPAWSPDGSEMAFVRPRLDGAGEEVWVMSTVTGATERATTWGMSEVEVTWVDPGRLLVTGIDPGETDPAIRVKDLETGDAPGVVFGSSPEVSPDGSRLAFVYEGRIWTIGLDAIGDRQVTDGPDDTDPTWSPDGGEIAFVRAGIIWAVETDGTGLRQVAEQGASPAWTPK